MLLMAVADTNLRYTNSDNTYLDAGYGDIVYSPYGSKYSFSVIPPYNPELLNQTKTICINFNIVLSSGEIVVLSDKPEKFVSSYNIGFENDFREILSDHYPHDVPV